MGDVNNLINALLSSNNLNQISQNTGANTNAIKDIAVQGLPAIFEGLNRNSNSKSGAESLFNALDNHDGAIMADPANVNFEHVDSNDGQKILGHILGNNRQNLLSQLLGKKTGTSSSQTLQVLSMLAPLIMGFLGKQKTTQNLDSNGINNLTTQLMNGFSQDHQSGNKVNFLNALFDSDNDGSVIDDVFGAFSKLF